MSISPTWFWPPDGIARASVQAWQTVYAVMGGSTVSGYYYSLTLDGYFEQDTQANVPGIISALAPGNGGWMVDWEGHVAQIFGSGSAFPSATYRGLTTIGTDVYGLNTSGAVRNYTGSLIGTFGQTPRNGMSSDGSSLFAALASGVGSMTTGGVSGIVAYPAALTVPTCFALLSSGAYAVGGWQNYPALGGAAAVGIDPSTSSTAAGVLSGAAVIWQTTDANNWTLTSTVTGLANLGYMSWVAGGTQVLATDATSGVVQVLNYSTGNLSLAQQVAVSGAGAIVVLPDGAHGLVAQPGGVRPLTGSLGTWTASGAAIPLTGVADLILASDTSAAVAFASGYGFVAYNSGLWSVSSTGSVPFNASRIVLDDRNYAYLAASGHFSVYNATTLVGSGAWAGGAGAILIERQQVVVADTTSNLLRVFQQTPYGWSESSNIASPAGVSSLAMIDAVLFAAGTSETYIYEFTAPYILERIRSGTLTTRVSGAWVTQNLGNAHIPSALAYSSSGEVWAATVENDLYTINVTGGIKTQTTVNVYTGQASGTPLSLSSLDWGSGKLLATTSLPGTAAILVSG